ncbi:MAG: beta-hydroxyacyl-ACP dehydratase [Planctomyces sp.]|nr:beta-hydroxyacyl-ACP dehydratase [Planctomyces sp.]
MRFSLIDRIESLEPGRSIRAVKSLSLAEEYLQDHFPGFPVMPGVLMVEALVQSSAWLMRQTEEFRYSTVLLREAKAVKFNSFLSPGKTLVIESTVHSRSPEAWTFKASGSVDGQSTVSARLTLEQFNPGDETPGLAPADERRIRLLQQEFAVLWPAAASHATSIGDRG